MLSFGNKEFRNLQEQVLKNAQDIEALKGRENLQIVIVEELPEEGNPNYIYLVPNNDEEEANIYDEYIWLADSQEYEKIGGVDIDLTNYVTLGTDQTITGKKTFTDDVIVSKITTSSRNLILSSVTGEIVCECYFKPSASNALDLGTVALYWRDLYLSGKYYLGTNKYIYLDSSNRIVLSNNGDRLKIDSLGNVWYVANAIPLVTNSYDLGSVSNYWKNLYLTGNISDGANTVSVTNIASKVTSTYASGTFDTNGEDTIDISGGTPEGLFIFACGNCQVMLHLTATMVQNAELTPIVVPCYYIETGTPQSGRLSISKSGTTLTLFLGASPLSHVDSGYAWTLTKTNLL